MVRRPDDAATAEGQKKAGDVGVGVDLTGGDNIVVVRYPHHSLVKGPVTELAESHAVADVIVLASAPGDDVGGINHGVTFRSDDPHPAQGAAVVVGGDDDPPEQNSANE